MEATAPFQYALRTRAGTDALARTLHLLSEADSAAVVLSLDGIGAYDHVRRAAMLRALMAVPDLQPLVPLVRLFYGRPSTYLWTDDSGTVHEITQGEGGEQGDPLMPALYALAQHAGLVAAAAKLEEGERILAFLDDLYVVAPYSRARQAFDVVAGSVEQHAGVRTHLGKLRAWCRDERPRPADMADLPEEIWVADASVEKRGLKVLGTPLGTKEFVASFAAKRQQEEQRLLDAIPTVPDLQCAWLLLASSAVPRANHLLRVVAPAACEPYAQWHDRALWECFVALLDAQEWGEDANAREVATLPIRLGGLGLRSALRTAPGAYVAGWLDALACMRRLAPDVHALALAHLRAPDASLPHSLAQFRDAVVILQAQGSVTDVASLLDAAPPAAGPDDESDPGEMRRGWQYRLCSQTETHYREQVVLPACTAARQAMLRSQSGPGAGMWLATRPRTSETTMSPTRFQVALRRRLRWPLQLGPRRCNGRTCGRILDPEGDHWASCMRSGRVLRRARPIERIWARICREAGARVTENTLLRDTGMPGIGPTDGRRLEVIATGLPLYRGVPLGIDATLVSALRADGTPWPRAASEDGVAIARAERAKATTYPELVESPVVRLVTVATEVGGRISTATRVLLRQLAQARARSAPVALQAGVRAAWLTRWTSMLSVAAQAALAATLVDDAVAVLDGTDGVVPTDADVWLDAAWAA